MSKESNRHTNIVHEAYEQHASSEVEIDQNATISEGDDNGAFVQAWLWVDFAGTDLDKKAES